MQSKKQLRLSAQRIQESVKAWKKGEHKPQPKKERDKNENITINFNWPDGVPRHRDINGTGTSIVYSLEDLGVVKDMETSEVSAINNQGNVAGTGYGGSESCAFKYDYLKNSWGMPAASTAADSVSAPRTW